MTAADLTETIIKNARAEAAYHGIPDDRADSFALGSIKIDIDHLITIAMKSKTPAAKAFISKLTQSSLQTEN